MNLRRWGVANRHWSSLLLLRETSHLSSRSQCLCSRTPTRPVHLATRLCAFCHPSPSAQVLGAPGHSTCRWGNHGIAIQPVHLLCRCWHHSPIAITPTPAPFITSSASSSQWLGILVWFGWTIAVSTWSGSYISATRSCHTFTVNQNSHLAGFNGPPGRLVPSGLWPKSSKYSTLVTACEESGFCVKLCHNSYFITCLLAPF